VRDWFRLYSNYIGTALLGGLFGYLLAKGRWYAGLGALGALVGGLFYTARHWGPQRESTQRRKEAERQYNRQNSW
jgi:hypothetical protein